MKSELFSSSGRSPGAGLGGDSWGQQGWAVAVLEGV